MQDRSTLITQVTQFLVSKGYDEAEADNILASAFETADKIYTNEPDVRRSVAQHVQKRLIDDERSGWSDEKVAEYKKSKTTGRSTAPGYDGFVNRPYK